MDSAHSNWGRTKNWLLTPSTQMDWQSSLLLAFSFTILIELLCVLFRFGFGMASTETTQSTIGALTMGIRVHHGYIGLGMLLLWPVPRKFFQVYRIREIYLAAAIGLFLSDAIHHFLVLWPIVGSPCFDLTY